MFKESKINQRLSKSLPDISQPFNFVHNVHGVYDNRQKKYDGLPKGIRSFFFFILVIIIKIIYFLGWEIQVQRF